MKALHVLDMVFGYVECALWSESARVRWDDADGFVPDPDSDTSFESHGFTRDDLSVEAMAKVKADCEDFVDANEADLDLYCGRLCPRAAGRDLWLTRNGHGTGFWDRGLGDVGDRLTDATRPMGESSLYLQDDGEIGVQ